MEARLYKKDPDGSVYCFLCRHHCHIKDGNKGFCGVRENVGGTLNTLVYGHPVAMAVDPIEKKPLYHFLPATKSFSIATVGCNFKCPFCQNWDISQVQADFVGLKSKVVSPKSVVDEAVKAGCKTIAYTYNEPTIFFEYAYDIALEAEKHGIKNIFVTNGFMTREMIDEFHPHLHAANIDLKAFSRETYKHEIKGDLKGVLDSIAYMKQKGIWIEITTLVVPGMNDSVSELKDIAEFISSVGKDIPWHISRFYPNYKMTEVGATQPAVLAKAYELGKSAGLKYVYVGNLPMGDKENTFCWSCGAEIIKRDGFRVKANKITEDSTCPKCNVKIDGVF